MNWISVNNRLPKTNKIWNESDYVLCYLKNHNEQVVCWYNSKSKEWYVANWKATDGIITKYVTHWRPLVKPPKP